MDTKTYEDWSKYLGMKPQNFGVVARMYPRNTLTYLTDGLKNVYYKDEPKESFIKTDSLVFEWQIDNNQIKHVEFAEVPEGDGYGGTEITMAFKENYYNKYDIFRIDETKQQCIVLSHPIRRSDEYWELLVRLIDNGYDSRLDPNGCQAGMTTTFLSVSMPELSELLRTLIA